MASASDAAVDRQTLNLQHVYFFLDQAASELHDRSADDGSPAAKSNEATRHPSRASSPGSTGTTESTTTATTAPIIATSSSIDTKPLAKSFQRCALPPSTAARLYELRDTADKGRGLFATSSIPRGTLIICEKPLLQITQDGTHLAWPDRLNLESSARRHLIDETDESLDEEDVDELVADQVRVMKIFSVNNFHVPKDNLAVFQTATRINHSCVPNVHHSYNPVLKQMTVYAVQDIHPGEELYITYIGGDATYETRFERNLKLDARYGFTCSCPACSDHSQESDGRRELIGSHVWGLELYTTEGSQYAHENQFIPLSNAGVLANAERVIGLMLTEGLFTIELTKVYRTASKFAFKVKNFDKAIEYAEDEAEIERNCLGTVVDDLVKTRVAAQCWSDRLRNMMREAKGEVEKGPKPTMTMEQEDVTKARKKTQRAEKAGKGVGMGDPDAGQDAVRD